MSNPMPELSAEQLAALRQSIEQDGVLSPVLLDRTGAIIDGFNRTAIAAELGVECPTYTLQTDPARTPELRVTLNLARRHLTTERWHALIAEIAAPHAEAIRAEISQRRSQGQQRRHRGQPPAVQVHDPHRNRNELARRVNSDLQAIGIDKTIAGGAVEEIMGKATKAKKTKGKAPTDPRVAAANASMRSIREADAYNQYRSMLAAPRGKLNLPFIRRAEQVQHLLVELSALDPEDAVTQIPIERCRQWLTQDARWWSRFTELCEQRWREETPEVPLMRYPRGAKLVESATPDQEYQLSQVQAAVLAFLRTQREPCLLLEIASAVGVERRSVDNALDRLMRLRLVRETTGEARGRMYEATDTVGGGMSISDEGEQ